MPELSPLDPVLVVDCFTIFIGCINVSNVEVLTLQGLKEVATVSAHDLFRALHHLMVMDPTSSVLDDLHRCYNKVFSSEVDSKGLPFYSTMTMVHELVDRFGNPRYVWWNKHTLPGQEHTPFSQHMLEAAQANLRQMQRSKVPRWMICSALHCMSLGSLSPASVVADYLTSIAIDMGCDVKFGRKVCSHLWHFHISDRELANEWSESQA